MSVEIRHCDWRDPDRGLSTVGLVDHLFADPPFTPHVHQNARTNAKGKHRIVLGEVVAALTPEEQDELGRASAPSTRMRPSAPRGKKVALGFDALTPGEQDELCARASAHVRRFIVIHTDFESVAAWKDAFESHHIEYLRCGLWLKQGAMPQVTGDRPGSSAEAIVIGHATRNGKPLRKHWNGGGGFAEYRVPVPHRKGRHPTEKPVPLLERMLDDFTRYGETIADTHLGSGTSLCAAIRRGRHGVGWERDEHWARVARKRTDAAREQFSFLDPPPERSRPKQVTLPAILDEEVCK